MYQYKQIIYFGAPGTGKSHFVKQKLDSVPDNKNFLELAYTPRIYIFRFYWTITS